MSLLRTRSVISVGWSHGPYLDRIGEMLKSPFPYYLEDPRKNTLIALFFSAAVVILLALAQHAIAFKLVIVGLTTFAVLFSNIVLLPRLLPTLLDSQVWTVGKYILFSCWHMLLCGIAIPIACHVAGIHPEHSLGEKILAICPKIVGYGFMPLTIVTLLMRNLMLAESLRNAQSANASLERIRLMKEDISQGSPTINIQSETKECLDLVINDLLFVEANDNYSTFYWRESGVVRKQLLRIKLKDAERQLDNSFAVRCHRSFLVNINAVASVIGNANGYKLSIRDSDFQVPVSRAKGKDMIEKIAQLGDVLEINSPQKSAL